jgi:hypothetical protein
VVQRVYSEHKITDNTIMPPPRGNVCAYGKFQQREGNWKGRSNADAEKIKVTGADRFP